MGKTPEGVRLFPRESRRTRLQHNSRQAAGRSQRRRASPGIKRAAFRRRLVGQILGQEPMSKFVRAVSPRIGEGLGASSVRPEGPGNVAE
jgi:hypothetical protein